MTEDEQTQHDAMVGACSSFAGLLKIAMRRLGVETIVVTWPELEAVKDAWLDVNRNDEKFLLECRLVEAGKWEERSN